MPAIVADITTRLLEMIGLESASDGPASVELSIIQTLQQAQALIADWNPEVFYFIRHGEGAVVRAPTTITLDVTQYATTLANVTGWEEWMAGCTVLIDGDTRYNRLLNLAADTTYSLQRPYFGSTGTTKNATVWADFIMLPTTVRKVMEPVTLDGQRTLTIAQNRADNFTSIVDWLPVTGLPERFFPLSWRHRAADRAGLWLDRLPGAAYLLTYDAKVAYTPITSLADTRAEILPQGADLSIFLPVARYLFADQPACSTPKAELKEDFERANLAARMLRVTGSRKKQFIYNPRR